ncbi:MFS transporter [Streptomyces sp. CAU 1734]|uniref:MFS transporter n=1 Tax=Streptomyces sp. CAU 1734 TaxID=3140360 RepID=UPI0032609FC9
MPVSPSLRPSARPGVPVRRLERRLLACAGFEDLILLYPLYAVLFTEHGLGTAQISSLFAIASLTGLLIEVPSGVWADLVSRRLVLICGPLLSAAGFALWVAVPSYGAFALGFVLWGAGGSLRSGAFEALAHDELERLGAGGRYTRLMGRCTAVSATATAVATAVAGPVHALGGYPVLGIASVAACLLCAAAAAGLPEHRHRSGATRGCSDPGSGSAAGCGSDRGSGSGPDRGSASDSAAGSGAGSGSASGADLGSGSGSASGAAARPGPVATLRLGLAEARGSGSVRYALLMAVVLTAIWGALDEYVPLLAAESGAAVEHIPFLVLAVWAGVTAGGLLADRADRLSGGAVRLSGLFPAGALTAAGALLASGALLGGAAGFLLLGLAFLVFQAADVVADARLQSAITGPSRATVTSLAGFGGSAVTLLVYAVYGAASGLLGHAQLFALFALPCAAVAAVMAHTGRTAGRERS